MIMARIKLIIFVISIVGVGVGWGYMKKIMSTNDQMRLQLTQYEQSNASLAETVGRLSFEKQRSEELLSDQVARNKKLSASLAERKAEVIKLGKEDEEVKKYLGERIPDQLFDQLREKPNTD